MFLEIMCQTASVEKKTRLTKVFQWEISSWNGALVSYSADVAWVLEHFQYFLLYLDFCLLKFEDLITSFYYLWSFIFIPISWMILPTFYNYNLSQWLAAGTPSVYHSSNWLKHIFPVPEELISASSISCTLLPASHVNVLFTWCAIKL